MLRKYDGVSWHKLHLACTPALKFNTELCCQIYPTDSTSFHCFRISSVLVVSQDRYKRHSREMCIMLVACQYSQMHKGGQKCGLAVGPLVFRQLA